MKEYLIIAKRFAPNGDVIETKSFTTGSEDEAMDWINSLSCHWSFKKYQRLEY